LEARLMFWDDRMGGIRAPAAMKVRVFIWFVTFFVFD
jgi:hypothetical protein